MPTRHETAGDGREERAFTVATSTTSAPSTIQFGGAKGSGTIIPRMSSCARKAVAPPRTTPSTASRTKRIALMLTPRRPNSDGATPPSNQHPHHPGRDTVRGPGKTDDGRQSIGEERGDNPRPQKRSEAPYEHSGSHAMVGQQAQPGEHGRTSTMLLQGADPAERRAGTTVPPDRRPIRSEERLEDPRRTHARLRPRAVQLVHDPVLQM